MKTMTLTLLLATAGAATWLYRRRPVHGVPRLAGPAPGAAASDEGRGWAPALPGDSPNAAERLQADRGAGSPFPVGADTDDLFASSSQQGEDPVAAGLPDLTRGA